MIGAPEGARRLSESSPRPTNQPTDAGPPRLAAIERPKKPLSTFALLTALPRNTLSVFDDELFEEPMVVRRYGLVTACFLCDPEGLKHVLLENSANYVRLKALQRLFEVEVGTGTLGSEGAVWRRHRRIAVAATDLRATRPDIPALIEIAERFVEEIVETRAGRKKPVDVQKMSIEVVMAMVNHVMSGGDPAGIQVLKWLATVPRKPRALDIVPKPEWASRLIIRQRREAHRIEADETLQRLIADRLAPDYAGGTDLLWRLANLRDREGGGALPPVEARDEAVSLLAAADATVRAITWTWHLLALHPVEEARLHAEVDAHGPLAADGLRKLDYVERVIAETIRLYPPVPAIVRKAVRSDEICGRRIPRGALVVVSPYLIHRHRRLWDDPDRFDPDRFADGARSARPKLAYMPFSAGPRVCPGATLSGVIQTIVVAAVSRRLKFLPTRRPVVPFGGISLESRGGLLMRAEAR